MTKAQRQARARKGGEALKQKYGREYFAEMGRRGGLAGGAANGERLREITKRRPRSQKRLLTAPLPAGLIATMTDAAERLGIPRCELIQQVFEEWIEARARG